MDAIVASPLPRAQEKGLRVFLPLSLAFHLLLIGSIGFLVPRSENPISQLPMEVLLIPPVLVAEEETIPLPDLRRPVKREKVEEKRIPVEFPEQNGTPPRKVEEETQRVEASVPPIQHAETPVAAEEPQRSLPAQKKDKEKEPHPVFAIPEPVVLPKSVAAPPPPGEPSIPVRVASLTMEAIPMPASSAPRKDSEGIASSGDRVRQGEPPLAKLSPSPGGPFTLARPRYAENPKPLYPAEARKKGYEGEVLLKVEVLADGRVGEIELKRSSGHVVLDSSAVAAVKQWRFIPARKGDQTVALWVNIPITFRLR
jgi:protein TonB